MYVKVAEYMDVKDISKAREKHHIFKTKNVFKDLIYTEYQATISEELPRLTLKLVTILFEVQAHQTKILADAIHTYNGIILISLLIFSVNMIIGIGRLTFELYQIYCRRKKKSIKNRKCLRLLLKYLASEIRTIDQPLGMDLNQLERVEEINE